MCAYRGIEQLTWAIARPGHINSRVAAQALQQQPLDAWLTAHQPSRVCPAGIAAALKASTHPGPTHLLLAPVNVLQLVKGALVGVAGLAVACSQAGRRGSERISQPLAFTAAQLTACDASTDNHAPGEG